MGSLKASTTFYFYGIALVVADPWETKCHCFRNEDDQPCFQLDHPAFSVYSKVLWGFLNPQKTAGSRMYVKAALINILDGSNM